VRQQRGFTIVELMVAMLLTSIVIGFTLAIYMRFSAAYHDQQDLGVAQQAARSATQYIAKQVRAGGYLTHQLYFASMGAGATLEPAVIVTDNVAGEGPDEIQIFSGDDSALAMVPNTDGVFSIDSTTVSSISTFTAGTIAAAVPTGSASANTFGIGCAIYIDAVDSPSKTISTTHTAGSPWNAAGNPQCASMPNWNDGDVAFVRLNARAYRIKPDDGEGVLQESPSGGIVANDWTDLGVGYTDLQVAMRVYQPGDATDDDGDGDPERDWFSGANMATALTAVANSQLLEVSITVVARTLRSTTGYADSTTPDLTNSIHPNNNALGDHASAASALPYLFRVSTTTIDLRNLGVGT
jgi:prepilin-type N-terminal cleavage/methylation domain-containing protein